MTFQLPNLNSTENARYAKPINDFRRNVSNQPQNNTFNFNDPSRYSNPNRDLGETIFINPNQVHKVQIYKWNLKFHGESNTMPVTEFLRRVHDLAISRGATSEDLYASASEFFADTALKWYRTGCENHKFRDWEDIRKLLLEDFEDYDYAEDLLEHIKHRLQRPDESVVKYFAIMEDLFIKLNQTVGEEERLKIIRKNLRPEFVRSMSTVTVHSLSSLKENCRRIETDMKRIRNRDRYSSPRRQDVSPRRVRFNEGSNEESREKNYELDHSHYQSRRPYYPNYTYNREYRNRSLERENETPLYVHES